MKKSTIYSEKLQLEIEWARPWASRLSLFFTFSVTRIVWVYIGFFYTTFTRVWSTMMFGWSEQLLDSQYRRIIISYDRMEENSFFFRELVNSKVNAIKSTPLKNKPLTWSHSLDIANVLVLNIFIFCKSKILSAVHTRVRFFLLWSCKLLQCLCSFHMQF